MNANSSNITKYKDYLLLLTNSKQKKRRNKLIDTANNNEISAISKCAKILLKKHDKHLKKSHKKVLNLLTKTNYPIKRKRALLKQKGGWGIFRKMKEYVMKLKKKK